MQKVHRFTFKVICLIILATLLSALLIFSSFNGTQPSQNEMRFVSANPAINGPNYGTHYARSAYASQGAFSGSMLDGEGILVGRAGGDAGLNTHAFRQVNGLPSGDGTVAVSNSGGNLSDTLFLCRDFVVARALGQYQYSYSGITVNNTANNTGTNREAVITSKFRLSNQSPTDPAPVSNPIYQAIQNDDMTVDFGIKLDVHNGGESHADVHVFAYWWANDERTVPSNPEILNNGNPTGTYEGVDSRSLAGGERYSFDLLLKNLTSSGLNSTAYLEISIVIVPRDNSPSNAMPRNVTVSNPSISTSVAFDSLRLMPQTNITISGLNRRTVSFATHNGNSYNGDEISEASRPGGFGGEIDFHIKNHFLKAGDIIRLEMKVEQVFPPDSGRSSESYKFTRTFLDVFGLNNLSGTMQHMRFVGDNENDPLNANPNCIVYDNFTGATLNSAGGRSSVIQKIREGTIGSENNWTYFTEFRVGALRLDDLSIYIEPMLYVGYDSAGRSYINRSGEAQKTSALVFKIDPLRPVAPTIQSNSNLGRAIANGSYYTDGESVQSGTFIAPPSASAVRSAWHVYAFVLPISVITQGGTLLEYSYDTFSLFEEDSVLDPNTGQVMPRYDFSVRSTLNPIETAFSLRYTSPTGSGTIRIERQQIHSFGEGDTVGLQGVPLSFGYETGEFRLILIAVNMAGGVSDPTEYTPPSNGIKIDAKSYPVPPSFLLGNSVQSFATFSRILRFQMFSGPSFHTDSGIFLDHMFSQANQYNAYDPNFGQSARLVRRHAYITIAVVMDATQLQNYQLVEANNYCEGGQRINPQFTQSGTNFIYYYTFLLSDEYIQNMTEGVVLGCGERCTHKPPYDPTICEDERCGVMLSGVEFKFKSRATVNITQDSFEYVPPSGGADEFINLNSVAYGHRFENGILIPGLDFYLNYSYFSTFSYTVRPHSVVQGEMQNDGWFMLSGSLTQYPLPAGLDIMRTLQTVTLIAGSSTLRYRTLSVARVGATDNFTVTAININDPKPGFIDAGRYYYMISVDTASPMPFFGTSEGYYEITRTSSGVIGLGQHPDPEENLYYGVSLKDIHFISYANDSRLPEAMLDISHGVLFTPVGTNVAIQYYRTSKGVLGQYIIINPQETNINFIKPDPGLHSIEVRFFPIDIRVTHNGDPITLSYILDNYFLYEEYYELDGTLKIGGKHAGNYAVQNLPLLQIRILPKPLDSDTVIELLSDLDNFIFNDRQQPVLFSASYVDSLGVTLSLPVIVRYATRLGSTDAWTAFSAVAPFSAGVYKVQYYIDPTSKYATEPKEIEFVLQKRNVELTVANLQQSNTTYPSYTDSEVGTIDRFTVQMYGRFMFASRTILAHFLAEGTRSEISVGHLYSLKLIRDIGGYPVIGEDFPELGVYYSELDIRSINAGTYLLKIDADHPNHAGSVVFMLVIAPASTGGAGALTVTHPGLLPQYLVYDVGATTGNFRGHLQYGETLSQMASRILNINQNTHASFTFVDSASGLSEIISGRFVFESEESIFNRFSGLDKNNAMSRNAKGELILPVAYIDNSNTITSYTGIYLYWEAGKTDEHGNFIRDYNFAVSATTVSIMVARATAVFEQGGDRHVYYENLQFGERLSSAVLLGAPVVPSGNVYADWYDLRLAQSMNPNMVYSRGTHQISWAFNPLSHGGVDYERYYLNLTVQIPLTVVATEATVNIVQIQGEYDNKHYFGATYRDPQYTVEYIDSLGNPVLAQSIRVEFSFFTLQGAPITINTATPVGQYVMRAVIDNPNLQGELNDFEYFVVKSSLIFERAPTSSVTFYGAHVNSIAFLNAILRTPNNSYSFEPAFGTFSVDLSKGYTVQGSSQVLYFPSDGILDANTYVFTILYNPSNAFLYEGIPFESWFNERFNEFYANIVVTVGRASPSITLTSATSKIYDGNIYNLAYTIMHGAVNIESIVENHVRITFNNSLTVPHFAGVYSLAIEVDSQNFATRQVFTITIEQKTISFSGSPTNFNDTFYTGSEVKLSFLHSEPINGDILNFSIIYYPIWTQGSTLSPFIAGAYNAVVTIVGDETGRNYKPDLATNSFVFRILPVIFASSQTQEFDSVEGIGIAFNPYINPMDFVISYRHAVTDMPQASIRTADAGDYNVFVNLTYNGITRTYIHRDTEMQERLVFTIDKLELALTAVPVHRETFGDPRPILVGTQGLDISASIRFLFSPKGEDNFTYTKPVNAGDYTVIFYVWHDNYSGIGECELIIEASDLIIDRSRLPYPDRIVEYREDITTINFVGGDVRSVNNYDMTSRGKFIIVSHTQEQFNRLPAGSHDVRLSFVLNSYPDNVNYNEITDIQVRIDIVRKNISEFIVFDESTKTQTYDGRPKSVRAYISGIDLFSPDGRSITNVINIVCEYNSTSFAPTSAYIYLVRAFVDDLNYQGTSLNDFVFEILKATPSITLPSIKDIPVGVPLSSLGTDAFSGGGAYIMRDGGSSRLDVQGRFSFFNPALSFSSANFHTVLVVFTPNDINNFTFTDFEARIFVLALELELRGVQASPISYGAKLSESVLTGTAFIQGTNTPIEGNLRWITPDIYPNVGDLPRYEFIPRGELSLLYNYVFGTISELSISHALVENDTSRTSVIMFVGQSTVNFDYADLFLYHRQKFLDETLSPSELEAWRVLGYTVSVVSGERQATLQDIGGAGILLRLRVTHRNYQPFEFDIRARVYNRLTQADFRINSTSKAYDGLPVTVADFKINASNTGHFISSYQITSIIFKGVEVSEIKETGSYTVTVRIVDDIYFAILEFSYTVVSRDISNAIKLQSGGTRIEFSYGDSGGNIPLDFIDPLTGVSFIVPLSLLIFNYTSKDGSVNYGSQPPILAGDYRLSIYVAEGSSDFIGGTSFDYIIKQREVEISIDSVYWIRHGEDINIVPSYFVSETVLWYILYNGVRSAPVNAGRYIVSVHIENRNYFGTSNIGELIILPAPVMLNALPVQRAGTSLSFGQALSEADMVGGRIDSAITGYQVSGAFVFEDPSRTNLVIGVNQVWMIFKPTALPNGETNFEDSFRVQVSVTVRKVLATIEVENASVFFNGQSQRPTVSTHPRQGLTVGFRFQILQGSFLMETDAINAGVYIATITILDEVYEGSITTSFTISKAQSIASQKPTASNIIFNQSISNSLFSGGFVAYFPHAPNTHASGTFVFTEQWANFMPNRAGQHYEVGYMFVPADSGNLEVFYGTVLVFVEKRVVSISVSRTHIIYGQDMLIPLFTTNPENLTVDNGEFLFGRFVGGAWEPSIFTDISRQNAGTYIYTAFIDKDNPNYQGSITYTYEISKKEISVSFIDNSKGGIVVLDYSGRFNEMPHARAVIDINSLLARDREHAEYIAQGLLYTYRPRSMNSSAYWFTPPPFTGDFTVTVSIANDNYLVSHSRATVNYTVLKGHIEKLDFDAESLSTQIYGNSGAPLVIAIPSDIQYEIIYVGLHGMPTSAGSYQVRVRATDPNYGEHDRTAVYTIQRKRITIENITVEDKREDGTPDIFATGTLRGVLQNDNLILRLEARTANGATAPGRYNVTITKWEIVGVSASNYDIVAPIFTGVVSIRFNQLFASGGGAFIESNEGLSANAVFKVVNNISAPENKTNLFTAMFGQRAEVFHVSVEENGHHVILTEKIKFSVPIPESYRNSKNLKAVGIGALSEGVTFEIQGNYVVFWSDRPGEFMIVANDFPYWAVAVGAILFSILLGFALIKLFVPARRKKKLSGKVRRQIDAEDNQKEVQMGIVNRQQRVITDKWRKDELID